MKNLLSRPLYLFLGTLIVVPVLIYLMPDLSEDILLVFQLLLSVLLAIYLHELGHIVFGEFAGFKFELIAFGPLKITKINNKIAFSENKHWSLFGGATYSYPERRDNMRRRLIIYTLGGPLFSLILAIFSYILSRNLESSFVIYFSIFNFMVFLSTILPINLADGFETDGASVQKLIKNNSDTKEYINNFLLDCELTSTKPPGKWDEKLVNEYERELFKQTVYTDADAKKLTFLFYYYSDRINIIELKKFLRQVTEKIGPENNRALKQGFYSSYILLRVLEKSDEEVLKEIKPLLQSVSKNEKFLYYRTLAIRNYLEDNLQEMEINLKNTEMHLHSLNSHNFGYMNVETKWFEELKKLIMKRENLSFNDNLK